MTERMKDKLRWLEDELAERRLDVEGIVRALKAQVLETPSWGYGNSGTRFAVFKQPGAARDLSERLEDAACVHRLTGICPRVAIHLPWDKVIDYKSAREQARSLGLTIGSINPNLFQHPDYKTGSLAHRDVAVRERALEHVRECVDAMVQVGSRTLSLWLADGTDYPGQDDFRVRKHRLEDSLRHVHEMLPSEATMLLEYKPFEPAFYHTDIADWGMSALFCRASGPKAKVLMDLGHHLPGANIEHLVALLIDERLLGGFHFNNRKYADDDLTTGSINPYEVFLIYAEVTKDNQPLEFMIDQSHIAKPKLEAMIMTVMFLQETLARALIIDRPALEAAQAEGDVVLAERVLQDAFSTDVRPLVARVREEMGAPIDPLMAYRGSGYQTRINAAREGNKSGAAGWG